MPKNTGYGTKVRGSGMNVGKRASGSGEENTKAVSRMARKTPDTGGSVAARSIMKIGPAMGVDFGNKGSMSHKGMSRKVPKGRQMNY